MRLALLMAMALFGGLTPAPGRVPIQPSVGTKSPFLLGILNRDGYAVPFASFDGRRWRAPWPDYRASEMPIGIDDVDKEWWGIGKRPDRMALWADGAKLGDVTLTELALMKSMCSTRLALRTNHKPLALAPPRMKQPYPKDGLLVAGDARVEPIAIVPRGTPEWTTALILIADKFNKLEEQASSTFREWRHPFDPRTRRLNQIVVEALYKFPNYEPGWTTYFVEAVRNYPVRAVDRECGLSTTGQGWVHVGPKDEVKIELTTRITYCDRKGVGFMLPFGVVRAGDRSYWVYQFSGFEGEWYQVVDPDKDGVKTVASFHAGSCPE